FGFNRAVGRDGTVLSQRGGGVVRVRPDGTEMEIYSWGQRNIVDIAIDPLLNLYTRDNTNDGGGWDIRLSHVIQSANYGYLSLYINFTDEIMPPLADYGGGSGCGALYFQDARWPTPWSDMLLTCDWGRSEVFSHHLPAHGATFDAQQDTFLKLPRPTDLDADGSGRMYVSSWKNGQFNYDGPNIGFVCMVTPIDFVPHPVPDLPAASTAKLVELLSHPADVVRLAAQRELLRRSDSGAAEGPQSSESLSAQLARVAASEEIPLYGRVAAVFTLKQLQGGAANAELRTLARHPSIREFCLRAMTDRVTQLEPLSPEPLIQGLADQDPRVRATAAVSTGRLLKHAIAHGWVVTDVDGQRPADSMISTAASALLPLTLRTEEPTAADGDRWRQADAGRVIPHLAVKALVDISATQECIAALNGPYRQGALQALRSMHNSAAVDGLFQTLSTTRDEQQRRELWSTLIRLYHREGEFTTESPRWWGTRPDTTGPYYDRRTWSESERIAGAIKVALSEADPALTEFLNAELKRHVVHPDGLNPADLAAMQEAEKPIELPKVDASNPNLIANLDAAVVVARAMKQSGNAEAGSRLFRQQSCVNCHTFANGQQPKGPHLVDIGKRYRKEELLESILDPGRKIAQGFDSWTFALESGAVYTGFVVLESAETVRIRETSGVAREIPQQEIEERVKQEVSMMPKGIVGNLTPEELADLISYLQSLH
ncbi:MAG: c-type cytochrome, partial [Planctomycetaceae bacterium]|nr:c-type cytochrome [Planctomycetaceae bacterium]